MMRNDLDGLQDFIGEAIANGWPDNTLPRADQEFTGFYGGSYSRGAWRYLDLWAGASTDAGMMIVFRYDTPSWICTYRGGILPTSKQLAVTTLADNELFGFLIEALRADADAGGGPRLRGPETHNSSDGRWRYTFQMTGTFQSFTASEHIYMHDQLGYERLLIGGLVGDGIPYGDRSLAIGPQ
jgi:hypothetical protein